MMGDYREWLGQLTVSQNAETYVPAIHEPLLPQQLRSHLGAGLKRFQAADIEHGILPAEHANGHRAATDAALFWQTPMQRRLPAFEAGPDRRAPPNLLAVLAFAAGLP